MNIDYIYNKYKKDVYYFLYHFSQNTHIAEDLTAEVFLSVIKSLPSFRGDSDIKTWLFSIAKLKWFEYLRKEKRIDNLNQKLSLYISQVDVNSEDLVIDKDMAEKIMNILDLESPKTKKIILMRANGFSYYEISREVDISENSARVIDFRTKKKIKKILSEEG